MSPSPKGVTSCSCFLHAFKTGNLIHSGRFTLVQQWHCMTSVSKCDLCILKTLLHLCIKSFFIYLFIWCCISSFSSLVLFVVLPFFPWIIFLGGLRFIFTLKSSLAHTQKDSRWVRKNKDNNPAQEDTLKVTQMTLNDATALSYAFIRAVSSHMSESSLWKREQLKSCAG